MVLSIIFTTYTRNSLKELLCQQIFTLCETSLVLKKGVSVLEIFWC